MTLELHDGYDWTARLGLRLIRVAGQYCSMRGYSIQGKDQIDARALIQCNVPDSKDLIINCLAAPLGKA